LLLNAISLLLYINIINYNYDSQGAHTWSKASAAYATKISVASLTKKLGSVKGARGYSAEHVPQRGRA
jgi:hypothetical protein